MTKLFLKPYIFLFIIFSFSYLSAQQTLKDIKVGRQPDGSFLTPSNQLLKPAGFQIYLPGRPMDVVLHPNQRLLFVKNRRSLDLILFQDRIVMQTLFYPQDGGSFTGIITNKEGNKIYITSSNNKIHIANLNKNNIMTWDKPITLPNPSIGGQPVGGGMQLSKNDSLLYVTLNRNNTLAEINMVDTSFTEIPVGVAPYSVILASPLKAYVSNWGGRIPKPNESSYPSSGTPTLVDPKTGIANNGTVSVIDLKGEKEIKQIEVGLHPSGMVLNKEKTKLYVACANSDIISVIDIKTDKVIEEISVHLDKSIPFGSAPNALTLSPGGKVLYVANGTDNAIAVIKTGKKHQIIGYIPTGWYPGAVISDKSGRFLFVANIKGVGSRNQRVTNKGFRTRDYLGSISIIPTPNPYQLETMSKTVKANNNPFAGYLEETHSRQKVTAVPVTPSQKSHFKHVVYIIKENRTYDQVFGDMKQGDGDSSLVIFGRDVTPNHHALAEEFVLLDNYYCSGILSADGHQWTDEAYVTDYLEKFFGGFSRSYPYDGDDPLAYASSGFIWDNVLRHGLTFRNYGEFVKPEIIPPAASFMEIYNDFIKGENKIKILAHPNLDQLTPYTCPTYIGFPNTVSDAYRAEEFIKEFKEFEKNDNFPNFIIMLLPNDHTSGTTPDMPTVQAAVADNDLALGKIIETISHSKYWKETCILITEDDSQNGYDHIDSHRTVGFVISPYTKRKKVISTYYTQINMVRTIENILGIPPMNQLDLAAEGMTECFTEKADFTPYSALPNNIPLTDINPPLGSLDGKARYWAEKSMEQDLDDLDRIEEDTFNRIIWHAVKGYDTPYPEYAVDGDDD